MYYFYDGKDKKMKGSIEEDTRYVVGWAERGCVTKFRIVKLKYLQKFYNSLNSSFSKIIHHFPPTGTTWISYNGHEGESADNIDIAAQNINWEEDYYATIVYRSACGFRMSILPKSTATTEYQLYKPSIGLTKLLVSLKTGQIIYQYGDKADEAKAYYNEHMNDDEYDI